MDKRETIESVVDAGLCTGCGTCVGICPIDAVEMNIDRRKGIYLPQADKAKCTGCGLCFEACPGHSVDFKSLNREIFGKEPDDILIGNYLRCYTGHATDYNIRYNSASGGLVTALLIFALEEGLIGGALVTRMSEENPLEPQPFIARTRGEIIAASKSKYCPVPANIALKEILQNEGKFAVVGLPCHIHGIRKAESLNKKLKEKIVLHIGIFCGHTPTFLATDFVLQKFKVDKNNIKVLDYRGQGWFGGMSIKLKGSNNRSIPYFNYWDKGFGLYFYPRRCSLCIDGTAELADISFGDAWLPQFKKDKIGTSILISRTRLAKEILQNKNLPTRIKINQVAPQKIFQSQKSMLDFKKSTVREGQTILGIFGKKLPIYNLTLPRKRLIDYGCFGWISFYVENYLFSKKHMWKVIPLYLFLKRVVWNIPRNVAIRIFRKAGKLIGIWSIPQ